MCSLKVISNTHTLLATFVKVGIDFSKSILANKIFKIKAIKKIHKPRNLFPLSDKRSKYLLTNLLQNYVSNSKSIGTLFSINKAYQSARKKSSRSIA